MSISIPAKHLWWQDPSSRQEEEADFPDNYPGMKVIHGVGPAAAADHYAERNRFRPDEPD